jgi:hypothetical protein
VKTENHSACATVNWKVCKSTIALYLSVINRDCVSEVLINQIILIRTCHFRHAYHPIRDNSVCVFLFVPSNSELIVNGQKKISSD